MTAHFVNTKISILIQFWVTNAHAIIIKERNISSLKKDSKRSRQEKKNTEMHMCTRYVADLWLHVCDNFL